MGMTREQLWSALGLMTVVEPIILSAYENEEEEIWRKGLGNSPHGSPWFVSFHGSSFPGDDSSVCGREQVYGLMNPAPEKPIAPWLRAWFDVGSDYEHNLVRRLAKYGVLLSADVTGEDEYQTGFSDPSVWLTGSPDAIILPPFWTKSHVVEIKTTEHEKVLKMISDPVSTPYSHKKYIRQLKTYIGLAHEKPFSPTVVICSKSGVMINNGDNSCSVGHSGDCEPKVVKVGPPDDGTLIYSSREEPLKTVSYNVTYDPNFLRIGRQKLKAWKEYFERDEIPPHIHEGQSSLWSVGPCKFCDMKKTICKPDYKEKKKKLSESNLINVTKKIRKDYNPVETRQAVIARWSQNDT